MTSTERNAVAICCGLLEDALKRNTGLYAENLRIGIKVLTDLVTTSVWYDANKRPIQYESVILVKFKGGESVLNEYRMFYADFENKRIEKWAYVDELLKL